MLFDSTNKDEIAKKYFELTGKSLQNTSCSSCFNDALIEINVILRKQNKKTMAKKAKIAEVTATDEQPKMLRLKSCYTFVHNDIGYITSTAPSYICAEYIAEHPSEAFKFHEVTAEEAGLPTEDVDAVGGEDAPEIQTNLTTGENE